MARILFSSGHSRDAYKWGLVGEVAKRLLEDINNEIYYLDCNGKIKGPCGLNHKKHFGYCKKCSPICLNVIKLAGIEEKKILKMEKYKSPRFPNFKSIKDVLNYEYDGYKLGLSPVSCIMTITRNYDFDIKKWTRNIHKFLETEYIILKNIEYYNNIYNFDEIHVFNGRMASMYPFVEFARKNNLKYTVYEVGSKVNKLRIIENSVPHDFYNLKNEIKKSWDKNATDRNELAEKWFIERRKGMFQASESFTKDQIKNLLPKDFDKTKENFAYFNSSIDEVIAFDSWKHPFAETENEIIEAMLEHYKNDETKHFYLRIHPNLTRAKKKKATQIKELYELKKKYKNLTLIEPDEKIDTYALIEACNKVLVSYSTVGAEATYWGKVAILAGKSPYEDYDAVYQAHSMEEFYKYIEDKNLTPKPKENAYPYGYYCETFGEEYKYYKTDSRKTGSFMGMKLTSR